MHVHKYCFSLSNMQICGVFVAVVVVVAFKLKSSILIGTLRSPTATSTKTSSQNKTLLYHKSFVIIPSRSRHILLAKYPENELVRETLR